MMNIIWRLGTLLRLYSFLESEKYLIIKEHPAEIELFKNSKVSKEKKIILNLKRDFYLKYLSI